MITHAYVPDQFVEQILNDNDTGQKMYEDYVTERINGNISLWTKVTKVAVVDGMVILHQMQSTALGTVVDLSHSFSDLLLSMTRGYDDIILVFDTYKDVSLKYATRECVCRGSDQCSTRSMMKRASNILPSTVPLPRQDKG